MKTHLLYLFVLIPLFQGCVANDQTGQMETGWLFWVFIGLLLGGVFLGALTNLLKKKKADDTPTKAEKEIEAYEETLKHKLDDSSRETDKTDDQDQ